MKSSWRSPFVLLSICFLACLLLLAYPLYVIRPFRHQGATELSIALEVMHIRPVLAVLLALLAVLCSLIIWKRISRPIARIGVGLLAALTLISGSLSFVNVYELMFQP